MSIQCFHRHTNLAGVNAVSTHQCSIFSVTNYQPNWSDGRWLLPPGLGFWALAVCGVLAASSGRRNEWSWAFLSSSFHYFVFISYLDFALDRGLCFEKCRLKGSKGFSSQRLHERSTSVFVTLSRKSWSRMCPYLARWKCIVSPRFRTSRPPKKN